MNPNFPRDDTWAALEPRRHWYLNFNFTNWTAMSIPGTLYRDYRWEPVSFWNQYIPSVCFILVFAKNVIIAHRN